MAPAPSYSKDSHNIWRGTTTMQRVIQQCSAASCPFHLLGTQHNVEDVNVWCRRCKRLKSRLATNRPASVSRPFAVSACMKQANVTVGSSNTSYGVQIAADKTSHPCTFHWNILVPPTAWGPHLDIAGGPMYRVDPLWPPLQSLRNVALSATHVSL